jgi:predicted nuclease of restriction endonuclease-like RecB superfamily
MPKSGARGGKRFDVDGIYFRSSWEANYARYLNWLISVGEIAKWEYEPDTFEFFKIKKGNRYYVPDFKVTNNDGSVEYHEVKGWMDARSKTKLDRMNRYYHDVKIVLIDADAYHAIAKQMKNMIPNWER